MKTRTLKSAVVPAMWGVATLAFILLGALLGSMAQPCVHEDDSFCTWDATVQGNGQGTSFVATWDGGPIFRF